MYILNTKLVGVMIVTAIGAKIQTAKNAVNSHYFNTKSANTE